MNFFRRHKDGKPFRELIWFCLFAVLVGMASKGGLFFSANHWIEERHASFHSNPASQQFVFVGIDTASIDRFGVWPWPRSIHAQVINKLNEMNVREIGIDIDFSTMSNPEDDVQLATAIANANGAIILPLFVQDRSAANDDDALAVISPHPIFAQNSELATVNVLADEDGIVRRFPQGMVINGEHFSSFPASLSRSTIKNIEPININYSIDPKTIPSYSVIDLLDGTLRPEDFDGKSVIYGAQAVELRDNFTVPVHGTLSGSIVQILATETLFQNLNITYTLDNWPLIAGSLFIIGLLLFSCKQSLVTRISLLLTTAGLTEALGLYLYVSGAIYLPTVAINIMLLIAICLVALLEVDFQRIRALFEGAGKHNAEKLFDQVFQDNVCGIIIIDEHGNELKRNIAADNFFNDPTTALPKILQDEIDAYLFAAKTRSTIPEHYGELELTNSSDQPLILEYVINGSTLTQLEGRAADKAHDQHVACLTVWDVTKRRMQEKQLEYLARFDNLTGALRRNIFEQEISENFAENHNCTIFAVNLHRFKTINLTLGRDVGDELLRQTVARLKTLNKDLDHICRLSGDSFAFCISKRLTPEDALKCCEDLISEFSKNFEINRAAINIGIRIGVSTRITDTDASTLLSQAEFALDEARKTQGNAYFLHQISLSQRHVLLRRIENDLWSALKNNEFWLAYQPQVDIKTGALVGAEALIRWDHPELGFISPADFIDLAEANGFIDTLGKWVLNRACEDALTLPDDMTIAVNVSPAQIMRGNMPQMVQDALTRTGLPASRLHIEITEAGFLEAKDDVVYDLVELREMGVSIALDDFGTGFSSLGYFAQFPINKIKVDQMFVRTLERGSSNEAIIRSVKTLSDGLDLKMICEGVETVEQWDILREIGVHEGQGYLFSRPIPISDLRETFTLPEKIYVS